MVNCLQDLPNVLHPVGDELILRSNFKQKLRRSGFLEKKAGKESVSIFKNETKLVQ